MGVNTLTSSYERISLHHKDTNPELSSKAPTLFEISIWACRTTIQLDKYLPTMAILKTKRRMKGQLNLKIYLIPNDHYRNKSLPCIWELYRQLSIFRKMKYDAVLVCSY